MSSLETVRKRRNLTLDMHRLLEHLPGVETGHADILVVSVASAPGGYVNLVPEALNFMVDAMVQIQKGEMIGLRQKKDITLYDNIDKTFPANMRYFRTLR
ncbi:hypothetical protein D3C86_1815550 [compost metagenome]